MLNGYGYPGYYTYNPYSYGGSYGGANEWWLILIILFFFCGGVGVGFCF